MVHRPGYPRWRPNVHRAVDHAKGPRKHTFLRRKLILLELLRPFARAPKATRLSVNVAMGQEEWPACATCPIKERAVSISKRLTWAEARRVPANATPKCGTRSPRSSVKLLRSCHVASSTGATQPPARPGKASKAKIWFMGGACTLAWKIGAEATNARSSSSNAPERAQGRRDGRVRAATYEMPSNDMHSRRNARTNPHTPQSCWSCSRRTPMVAPSRADKHKVARRSLGKPTVPRCPSTWAPQTLPAVVSSPAGFFVGIPSAL